MRKFFVSASISLLLICCITSSKVDCSAAGEPEDVAAQAANHFGYQLLRVVAHEDRSRNVMLSPLSVAAALTIAYNGASGSTKEAIATALGIKSPDQVGLNQGYRDLLGRLGGLDHGVQLNVANALWVAKDFKIKPSFIQLGEKFFFAHAENVDFDHGAEEAQRRINSWVSENTRGRISEILQTAPPQGSALLLTDAIYFNGQWATMFNPYSTRPRPFHLGSNRIVATPMMSQDGKFPYVKGADFEAIALPYGTGEFEMYVVLPSLAARASGILEFVRSHDDSFWSGLRGRMFSREGTIVLPKINLECQYKLNNALSATGMGIAFSRTQADFSEIPAKPEKLWVTSVEHAIYIRVDERGTEADAGTSIGLGHMKGVFARFNMIVDHPFFCAIVERKTGVLLFAGIINDPTAH